MLPSLFSTWYDQAQLSILLKLFVEIQQFHIGKISVQSKQPQECRKWRLAFLARHTEKETKIYSIELSKKPAPHKT